MKTPARALTPVFAASFLAAFTLGAAGLAEAALSVSDVSNDGGDALRVSWQRELPDTVGVRVERLAEGETEWSEVAVLGAGAGEYVDSGLERGKRYSYRLRVEGAGTGGGSIEVGSAAPRASWFREGCSVSPPTSSRTK